MQKSNQNGIPYNRIIILPIKEVSNRTKILYGFIATLILFQYQ